MNNQDPTLFPSNAGQWEWTSDMSGLLWEDNQQPISPEEWDGSENSEMYKKVIDSLLAKVQSKYGELNSMKFAGDNQNAAMRNDILKTVFDTMRQAGINPSDQNAINEFMAELEQNNPDLFELFNEALNALLGWSTEQPTQDNAPTWDLNTDPTMSSNPGTFSSPENIVGNVATPKESLPNSWPWMGSALDQAL